MEADNQFRSSSGSPPRKETLNPFNARMCGPLGEVTTKDVLTPSAIRTRTDDFANHFEARAATYMSSHNIRFGRDNIYSEVPIYVS
jgi:hypothetical protein